MKPGMVAIIFFAFVGSVFSEDLPDKEMKLSRISFFFDGNLNGRRDHGEPSLTKLKFTVSGFSRRKPDGSVLVTANRDVTLRISGIGPSGKALRVATYREPEAVVLLPEITLSVAGDDIAVGLADGYMTSPLRPGQLNLDDYKNVIRNPAAWKSQCAPLYPKGWAYEGNYFFYGYRIPSGGLRGMAHLAFDLWARPGIPVVASVPGVISKPLFDWNIGISGPYGTVYYSHIVPAVKVGDEVKRYDVVGYIAEGQGNHVHLEIRPDPAMILEAFPGVNKSHFLKSPLKGEGVPIPPYFGPDR